MSPVYPRQANNISCFMSIEDACRSRAEIPLRGTSIQNYKSTVESCGLYNMFSTSRRFGGDKIRKFVMLIYIVSIHFSIDLICRMHPYR